MKKGIELPINILVIVALAVVVLLGVVAMYMSGTTPFIKGIGYEGIKTTGCRLLLQDDCTTSPWQIPAKMDVDEDGAICPPLSTATDVTGVDTTATGCTLATKADSLQYFMEEHFGSADIADTKKKCGCPGYY